MFRVREHGAIHRIRHDRYRIGAYESHRDCRETCPEVRALSRNRVVAARKSGPSKKAGMRSVHLPADAAGMPRDAAASRRLLFGLTDACRKKPLKKRCFVFDRRMAAAFVRVRRCVVIGAGGGGDDALSNRGSRFFFARGVDSGKKRD
jgi:hypothetical protein